MVGKRPFKRYTPLKNHLIQEHYLVHTGRQNQIQAKIDFRDENSEIFLSVITRPRAMVFGMCHDMWHYL